MSSAGQMDSHNPSLRTELTEKMILDLSHVELHENFQDYVLVHFSIRKDVINVKSIEGTHSEVIELVKEKLISMEIDSKYEEDRIYSYKFTFEKQ